MKKTLTILIILIIILLVGGGVWWFLGRPESDPTATPNTSDPSSAFPISQPNEPPPLTFDPINPNLATNPPDNSTPGNLAPSARLISLSTEPVAGYHLIPAATSTEADHIIFLEQNTGRVVNIDLERREPQVLARLPVSLSTSGIINDVSWLKNGGNLVLLYSTLSAGGQAYARAEFNPNENSEVGPVELQPEPLNPQITSLAANPSTNSVFSLETLAEGQIGKIINPESNSSRLVFESDFGSWQATWVGERQIALNQKPAGQADSFLYFLNPQNGNLTKIMGGIRGLNTLTSPDANKILYSDSSLNLNIYRRDSGENIPLSLRTLAEKCLWANSLNAYCAVPRNIPPATYPNDWLNGKIVFNDLLWRLDAEKEQSEVVWADDQGLGDAHQLGLSSDNRLIFVDHSTSQLYLTKEAIISEPVGPDSETEPLDEQNTHDQ